jgi:probable HAF family extracellular repeat protein
MSLSNRIFALTLCLCWGLVSPAVFAAVEYTVRDLGSLSGGSSEGWGINNHGDVAGFFHQDNNDHAFLHDGTMQYLGSLGGLYSRAFAVNDNRQAVGLAPTTGDQFTHAFLYDGSIHDLGTLGGSYSEADEINANGHVAGSSTTSQDVFRAFYYDGSMHALGTLGGAESYGTGINDRDDVVGYSYTTDGYYHAFIHDVTIHDLGTLGGLESRAYSINNHGHVTGWSTIVGDAAIHAFLYDGTMHDLGTLDNKFSFGNDVNDHGQVVGYYASFWGSSFDDRAFLYDSGRGMIDLNTLINSSSGWFLINARAINNSGQITGNGYINGELRAYLLTPVPEPATIALAALSLGTLLVGQRPRRMNPFE